MKMLAVWCHALVLALRDGILVLVLRTAVLLTSLQE